MTRLIAFLMPMVAMRPSLLEEATGSRHDGEHRVATQAFSVISSETALDAYWRSVHAELPSGAPGLERRRFEVLVEMHPDRAYAEEFMRSGASRELMVEISDGWCGPACFTVEGTPEHPVPTIWISAGQTWVTENPYDLVKTQMIIEHEFHHFVQWRDNMEARTQMQDSVRIQAGITPEQHCRFRLAVEVDAYHEVCTGELARRFPEAIPGECGPQPVTLQGIFSGLSSRDSATFAACL